jgi:hypothetical protein
MGPDFNLIPSHLLDFLPGKHGKGRNGESGLGPVVSFTTKMCGDKDGCRETILLKDGKGMAVCVLISIIKGEDNCVYGKRPRGPEERGDLGEG